MGSGQCGDGVDRVAAGGFTGGVDPFRVHPVGQFSPVVGHDALVGDDPLVVGGGCPPCGHGGVEVPVVDVDKRRVKLVAAFSDDGDVGQGTVGGLADAAA